MQKKDWDKIYDSVKYLKRFLNNFNAIYLTALEGREVIQESIDSFCLSDNYSIDQGVMPSMGGDFFLFCFDFRQLLESVEFTKAEKKYIELWMNGYTEKAIADEFNILREGVHCRIISACEKIISAYQKNVTK